MKAIGYLLPYSHIKLRLAANVEVKRVSALRGNIVVERLSAEPRIDNLMIIRSLYSININVTATTSKVSPWSRVQTPPRAHELRLHARVTQWSEWGSYEGKFLLVRIGKSHISFFRRDGSGWNLGKGFSFWFSSPRAIRLCTASWTNQDSPLQFPTVLSFLIVHPSIRAGVLVSCCC